MVSWGLPPRIRFRRGFANSDKIFLKVPEIGGWTRALEGSFWGK